MTKIEQCDDKIFELKKVLYQIDRMNSGGGIMGSIEITHTASVLLSKILRHEIDELTAERNNLIRYGY